MERSPTAHTAAKRADVVVEAVTEEFVLESQVFAEIDGFSVYGEGQS